MTLFDEIELLWAREYFDILLNTEIKDLRKRQH